MELGAAIDALLTWSEGAFWDAVLLVGAALLGLTLHAVVYAFASRLTARTGSLVDDSLQKRSRRPARLLMPLVFLLLALPATSLSADLSSSLRHAISLALIGATGWLVVSLTRAVDDVVDVTYPLDVEDNLHARQLRTQVGILRKVLALFVTFVSVAIMLMTFPEIRELGASLLASAGLAGLVVGMAARPTLASLVAGVQLALTQPIRLDDVVVIEGEWGRIEDIRTTFVVVRIWDSRRLVVPLSYFIEKPIENWTRETAEILGTVLVYADYTVPVEAVRDELHRILESSDLWDGKSWGLQVTNATPSALELRAVMSAPDSGAAWNLRCHVREELVSFLRDRYRQSLPRTRAEIESRTSESGGEAASGTKATKEG